MPAPPQTSAVAPGNGPSTASVTTSPPPPSTASSSHGLFARTSSIFVSNRKARERAALAAAAAAATAATAQTATTATTTTTTTPQQEIEHRQRAHDPRLPITEEDQPVSPIASDGLLRTHSLSRTASTRIGTPHTQHSRVPSDTSLPANLIPTRTSSKASKRTHRYSTSTSHVDIGALRRSVSLRSVSSPQKHDHGPSHSNSTLALTLTSDSTLPDSSSTSFSSTTRPQPPPQLFPSLAKWQRTADSFVALTTTSTSTISKPEVSRAAPPEPVRSHTDPMLSTSMSTTHHGNGTSAGRPSATSASPLNTSNTYASSGIGSTMQTTAPIVAGSQTPQMIYQHIMDTASKRISTLDYLRKAHEGRVYWFNTLLFTKPDLLKFSYFQPTRLARRATNYLLLGFSLPTILDLNSQTPTEYLKALNALLVEFDQFQQLHPPDGTVPSSLSRARVPQMFKRTAGKNRRASSAADSSFLSALSSTPETPLSNHGPSFDTLSSGESYTLLLTPSLPFDPDFFETFATLCDVLIDCYTKVTQLVKGPEMCTGVNAGIGDLFGKADARIRKVIVAGVVREFEERCREGVRGEVAGVGRVVLGGLM